MIATKKHHSERTSRGIFCPALLLLNPAALAPVVMCICWLLMLYMPYQYQCSLAELCAFSAMKTFPKESKERFAASQCAAKHPASPYFIRHLSSLVRALRHMCSAKRPRYGGTVPYSIPRPGNHHCFPGISDLITRARPYQEEGWWVKHSI